MEPEDAVRRRVLRTHVEDLTLVLDDGRFVDEVVVDGDAALDLQRRIDVARQQFLCALVGGVGDPVRLLGACDPDVVSAAPLVGIHGPVS